MGSIFSFEFDDTLRRQLKSHAAQDGITMRRWINLVIEEALADTERLCPSCRWRTEQKEADTLREKIRSETPS